MSDAAPEPVEGEAAAPAITITVPTNDSAVAGDSVDAAAAAASPFPSDAAGSPSPLVVVTPPSAAAEELTPEQLRARKLFDRWQKTFLAALDKQSEDTVVNLLRDGEEMVSRGLIDVNRSIRPSTGATFLHVAVAAQKLKIAEWLLSHGANPNASNLRGASPLHLVCEAPQVGVGPQMIQLLIDFGGDVEHVDGGDPPTSSTEKAAAAGFDVTALNFDKQREFLARRAGAAASANENATANTDSASSAPAAAAAAAAAAAGLTDAERAAAADKARLVYRKLSTLFLGLDAEQVSQAVDDAIVRILTTNLGLIQSRVLDIAAAPLAAEGNQQTFLHLAVIARRPEIVRVLLRALTNAELDAPDESGNTALHVGVSKLSEGDDGRDIVAQLLDAGASTTATNYLKGLTPMQMLPPETPQEARAWLAAYVAKTKTQGGGALGVSIVPPSPENRAGARAFMSRMTSGLAPPSKVPALSLIQKATGGGGGGLTVPGLDQRRSVSRASGGSTMLSGALQQIMSSSSSGGGAGGAAAASSNKPLVRRKAVHEPASLGLDSVFTTLDLTASDLVTPAQLLAYHEDLHACGPGTCSPALVQQALECVTPAAPHCTRDNLYEVLGALSLLCAQHSALRWDFRLMDEGGLGALDATEDSTRARLAPAELVWNINSTDDATSQISYEEFIARKTRQEKARPKEVRWIDINAELAGKMPSIA